VRIAWQQRADQGPEYFDTGVEILSGFDYWGISFEDPALAPVPAATPLEAAPLTVPELLGQLKESVAAGAGERSMEMLWCGLVEHLEAKQLITREELVTALRSIAEHSPPETGESRSS
jgi:hypothetical protein